eukprot:1323155-Ditylum_brightwellii.AAC.1
MMCGNLEFASKRAVLNLRCKRCKVARGRLVCSNDCSVNMELKLLQLSHRAARYCMEGWNGSRRTA